MELFDLGKALEAQLFGSHESLQRHPFFDTHPGLLSRLVSKLTYCVRDAQVHYIAVDMSHTSVDGAFNIAVYTEHHLFHLSYDPAVDHITTSILARRTVQLVEVLSAPDFMSGDVPGSYEGSVRVAASYPGLKVWLPGDNAATEQNRHQLDDFLPSLMADLARP